MAAFPRTVLPTLLIILHLTAAVIGQLVLVNRPLEVAIGRTALLDESVLAFQAPGDGEKCKVEVAVDEPFYQRVGKLDPQVFDCEFFPGTIRYIHSGSPLLDQDVIKLRAYMLTDTDTVIETFYIRVNVTREPYRVVQPMMNIAVDEFNGISDPIDMRILDFDFDRSPEASCFVRVNTVTSGLPRYGHLIRGVGDETQDVRALYENCDDFLYLNLRYQHVLPPSPNMDYIPLSIEVDDPQKHDQPFTERLYLPVDIVPAFENQHPVEAFLAQYILDVDQFILTTITTDVMSGSDDETRSGDLIFYVSKPPGPGEGSIVHLDDQSRPIESFRQADLSRLNIAYKAPDRSYPTVRLIEIEFVVYDEYFAKSDPVTLTVAVQPTQTNAPRVSVNRGLTLLEGQSRPIRPQNLEIVDNDNLDRVRIKVVSGPRHGRVLLNNRPMIMFTPRDIAAGSVVYRHDDSDTLKDSIELRITDMSQTVHTSFPINILPNDDSAPTLIRNIQIEVNEGQTVRVTRFALLASDKDSNDDYIVYRITTPPQAGEILKKYSADSFGYPVTDFTQRDLFRGMIYYHHLGQEQFMDSFDIILLDNSIPPNVSPTQVVLVSISPVHDLPPEVFPGATLSITVKETEIAFITREHLRYTDTESDDGDLRYTITTPPYVISTHSLTDAGRIFSTTGVVMPMKDPTIPAVRTFQQRDIDHHTIAYMPPFKEIGPDPREIRFLFSVSDLHGNVVLGQTFDITVLPVNNRAPVIFTNNLMVAEGGILRILPTHFMITDMDTSVNDLVITLTSLPEYGVIVVGNVNLTVGGTFTVGDLSAGRVRYIHGGSEVPSDEFSVAVSDGVHSVSRKVLVSVSPVNDQLPEILPGLITRLTIAEGGEIPITSEVLAATDVDTNDMLLHFIVVQHPKRGVVLRNGIIVNRFTQQDVRQGSISYVHMGGETGKVPVQDSISFVVSDKSIPSSPNLPVHDIQITITPVDNQAPGIVFGNPYFVNEGGKAPLTLDVLSAIDRDSDLDQLTFHIVGQPQWGLVENILPSPGYEKSNAGKPIVFFRYQDIVNGNINYVQFNHSGIEPMADSFILYVSDGEHLSPNVSFTVNIIPVNDEVPVLTVQNFTVYENSFFKLSTDYIMASDLDIPMEMLMFSVIKSPRYGSLVDWALPAESRLPIFDFNLNQLLNTLRLTYVHDGSESSSDDFAIRVTDGKHTVQKSIFVTITQVNDEPPEIIKNAGITLDIQESRIISPVVLLTTDGDTAADQLYYSILTLPRRGVLQRKLPDNTWMDIAVLNSNFTQEELDLNLIRYLHTSDLGSKGLDRFRFDVTDGVHSTGKQSFRIDITNTKREPLQLINSGVEVLEGEFVIIPPECLTAFDNSNNPAEISFTINNPPTEGQLEDISRPGIPISAFSQISIIGQRVIYVHKRTDRIRNDNFMFSVTNGYQTRNDTFHIVVIPVDNALPSLIINEPLEVPEGGSLIIPPSNLEAIDQDTPPHIVTFIITHPLQFGRLLLAGIPITDRFTQHDLNNYDLSYQHFSHLGQTDTDSFYFVVTDNTNQGFLIKDSVATQPVKFTINIDRMDSEPPRLITNEIPIKMESRNGRYAFILSRLTLYAEDQCAADGITFMIIQEPQHGYLENLVTRRRVQGQFTQQEIDDRSIMYIMNENIHVNNDSFMFSIYDCNGNALMGQRFDFRWPHIQFTRGDYMVCEAVGTLQINIMRAGYHSLSSFVDIEVSDLTAVAGQDYAPPRARQLQFDPGVNMATWDVDIIADELEENRERFRLTLTSPVNAVLGEHDKLTVIIKDSKDGACKGENHGVTITDTLPSCCPSQGSVPPEGLPSCCPDPGQGIPYPGPLIPQQNPGIPVEDPFSHPPKPGDTGLPPEYPFVPGSHPSPEGYLPYGGEFVPDQGFVYPGEDPGFVPNPEVECCPPDPVPGQGQTGHIYPQQPDPGYGPYQPQQPGVSFDPHRPLVYPDDPGAYPRDSGVYSQNAGAHQTNPEVYPQNPQVYPQNPGGYPQDPSLYPQDSGSEPQYPDANTQQGQWNPGYPNSGGQHQTGGGNVPPRTYPDGSLPPQPDAQGQPVWPYYFTRDGQPYYPDQGGDPASATNSQGSPYQGPGRPYQQGQDAFSSDSSGGTYHQGGSNPQYPAQTGAVPQYPSGQGWNPQDPSAGTGHQPRPGDPYYPGTPAQYPYQQPAESNPYLPESHASSQGPDHQFPPSGQNFQSAGRAPVYAGEDPNPNPVGSRPQIPGRASNGQSIHSRPGSKVQGQPVGIWTNGSTTIWTLHGIASSPIVVRGHSSSSSSSPSSSSSSHQLQPFPAVVQGRPSTASVQESGVDPDGEPVPISEPEPIGEDVPEQPPGQAEVGPDEALPADQSLQLPPGCTTTSKDDFLIEESTGSMYKCNGNRWVRVEWSHIQADDATNQDVGCGDGWHEFDGMCYLLATEPETWDDAQRICRESYQGNLVTVSTNEIYNWIRPLVQRREFWIGLNDQHTLGQWEWASGEPVTFTRWKVGSPVPGTHGNRNCVSQNTRFRWIEKKCDNHSQQYVCEKRLR